MKTRFIQLRAHEKPQLVDFLVTVFDLQSFLFVLGGRYARKLRTFSRMAQEVLPLGGVTSEILKTKSV
jgi:hypothetical protein